MMESFESPVFRPNQPSRLRLLSFDRPGLSNQKEDDFVLDNNLKIEPQDMGSHHYSNFAGSNQQYDGLLDGGSYLRFQEYDVGGYRINRSRGPSFNLSKERRGSEDLFGAGSDFMNLFRNYNDHLLPDIDGSFQQAVKTEFDPHQLAHEEKVPMAKNIQENSYSKEDQNGNFAQENLSQRDTSEGAVADESTLQLSGQGSDADPSVENPLSSGNGEGDFEPAIKKKRKTNNNKVVDVPKTQTENISKVPKLKKSKSENKNALYSVTPKGNSLSLKIMKLPDSKDSETQSKPKTKKSGKDDQGELKSDYTKVEDTSLGRNDKAFEANSNGVSQPDQIPFMRSNSNILSSFLQGKTGNFGDLVAGLGLPAEVEEMLNSSKIFNNIQSSLSRKIGPLTVEERKAKVEKYFEKRKNRSWCKRINYDCRKRVADSRLRFKGRFVTKTQAFGMLSEVGIFPDPNKITETEIKELLEAHFGSDPVKKKEKEVDGRKNNGRPKKQLKLEDAVKQEMEKASDEESDDDEY